MMIANKIWVALGQPEHYIEPFFGSGAVLLNRPDWNPDMVETVNDADGHISNLWRAIKYAPEETAEVCDWPVNHADLCARRRRLLSEQENLLKNLIADDKYFNVELAGYWIWAASCWIGSGLTYPGAMPHIGGKGQGINAIGQRPHISRTGDGVHSIGQIPEICHNRGSNAGKRPDLSKGWSSGAGVHSGKGKHIYQWFDDLSYRLRKVRVVCGDWSRVCGGNWQDNLGNVGIFFDPPYASDRDDVYGTDSFTVANDVREWCIKRGDMPAYRIVLCGYDEHGDLANHGWESESWQAHGGYSNSGSENSRGKKNKRKEMIWYSPHCLREAKLF